ncbi:hypothetical protein Tco_0206026 [Tanacetum coccineum]
MAEPILNENMKKDQTESNLSITSNDINIELNKEFLEEIQMNAYHRWIDEDVVNHIAKVLEMVDLIYVPGKITVWEELVEKFFCKFYPESYDGEDEITKKELFHAWMNGNWNKRRIDDSILRSNNATIDSFFKPYLITHGKSDTEKEDEQSQTKCKYSNTSNSIDEQPNKRRYKEEKFEVIRNYGVLGEDILKITILTPNTSYPSRKIRRIRACTHQRPQRKQAQYAVFPEDLNTPYSRYGI